MDCKGNSVHMKTALLAVLLLAVTACGSPVRGLHVENGWASPTPGGVDVSAGYLTIVNDTDTADRLLSASTPRATSADFHAMSMTGPVMQMRSSGPIAIPAHGRVMLAPGGTHLMFNGVTQPFALGETIPVQLTFERAGVVSVELPVSRSAPGHAP
jgi:copper(I)-binding protein